MLQQKRITKNSYLITAGEMSFTIDRFDDGGKFYLHIPEKGKFYLVGTLETGVGAIITYLKNTGRYKLLV